jgi:hypothetical protein
MWGGASSVLLSLVVPNTTPNVGLLRLVLGLVLRLSLDTEVVETMCRISSDGGSVPWA